MSHVTGGVWLVGVDADVCGITDTFTRDIASGGWGTSDAGLEWLDWDTGVHSVVDGHGVLHGEADTEFAFVEMVLPYIDPNFRATMRVRFAEPLEGGLGNLFFEIDSPWGDPGPPQLKWRTSAWIDGSPGSWELNILAAHGIYPDRVSSSVPFEIDPALWYQVKLEQDNGVELRIKMWEDDTSEPSGWTLTLDLSGQVSPDPVPLYGGHFAGVFYMQIWGNELTSAEMWIDDLNLEWITKCTAVQFETFNRTVASGLGTTTPSGHGWVVTGSSGTYGVDGSAYAQGNLGFVRGAIDTATEYGGDFEMTSRIKSTLITAGGPTPAIHYKVFDRLGPGTSFAELSIKLNSTVGGANPGGLSFAPSPGTTVLLSKTDWLANQWYLVKWNSVEGVKVWLEGTAEPSSWDIAASVPSAPWPTFQLSINAVTSSRSEVDYIDFDYDGRPPYRSASGVEEFERPNVTVVELDGTANPNLTQWGFGPLGQWSLYAQIDSNPDSGSGAGIESETGVHRRFASASPASGRLLYAALPPRTDWTLPIEVIADSYRESLTNNGIELWLMSTLDSPDDVLRLGSAVSLEAMSGGGGGGATGQVSVDYYIHDGGGDYSYSGDGDFTLGALSLSTFQTHRVRWLIEETLMRGVVYKVNDPQPDWQVEIAYPAGTLDALLASARLAVNLWCHDTGATYLDRLEVIMSEPVLSTSTIAVGGSVTAGHG